MKGVDTSARIRREFLVRGRTIKEIVRDLHVSRNTVRKVLRPGATEFSYEREVQPLPKLGRWKVDLDRILASNEAKHLLPITGRLVSDSILGAEQSSQDVERRLLDQCSTRVEREGWHRPYETSMISASPLPIDTRSPTTVPATARASGDTYEMLPAAGLASSLPTMRND
jgi:hypothetical protein